MLNVQVNHLRNRYVGLEGTSRLDRLTREALPPALEAALALAGIQPWEDVCIPELEVRTRLSSSGRYDTLPARWATSVADAVSTALVDGGVVRYPNRTATLLDLVRSATAGRLERSWAWRELDLWPEGSEERPRAAAAEALLTDPTAVVPVLRGLARRPGVVSGFLAGVADAGVVALAQAARVASGSPSPVVPVADAAEQAPSGSELRRAPVAPGRDAEWASSGPDTPVVPSSLDTLGRALEPVAAARPELRGELAVLALLGRDPTALRDRRRARRRIESVVLAWERGPEAVAPPVPGETTAPSPDGSPAEGGSRRQSSADSEGGRDPLGTSDATPSPPVRPGEAVPTESASPTTAETVAPAPRDEGVGAPQERVSGRSGWGGVFFLLNALEDHGIAARLLEAPELAARSGRWILHRLSGLLVDAPPADPARLGFCGLRPDEDPPASDGPPSALETEALAAGAEALLDLVGRRLGGEALDPPALYDLVARPTRVVGDPGWIEVHLSLDSVSVPLRKAGLDRDPGYLAWLGVVVRFVYA